MKTYKKIDIYLKHAKDNKFYYECSCVRYKTCKEAKLAFLAKYEFLNSEQVKTCFSVKP